MPPLPPLAASGMMKLLPDIGRDGPNSPGPSP